ncbi:unnamed protein product, partial [Prorocentrum cordatum]
MRLRGAHVLVEMHGEVPIFYHAYFRLRLPKVFQDLWGGVRAALLQRGTALHFEVSLSSDCAWGHCRAAYATREEMRQHLLEVRGAWRAALSGPATLSRFELHGLSADTDELRRSAALTALGVGPTLCRVYQGYYSLWGPPRTHAPGAVEDCPDVLCTFRIVPLDPSTGRPGQRADVSYLWNFWRAHKLSEVAVAVGPSSEFLEVSCGTSHVQELLQHLLTQEVLAQEEHLVAEARVPPGDARRRREAHGYDVHVPPEAGWVLDLPELRSLHRPRVFQIRWSFRARGRTGARSRRAASAPPPDVARVEAQSAEGEAAEDPRMPGCDQLGHGGAECAQEPGPPADRGAEPSDGREAGGAGGSGAAAVALPLPSPRRQRACSRQDRPKAPEPDAARLAAENLRIAGASTGGKGPSKGPGKGRSLPAAPRAAGGKGSKRGSTPLGRRFHWQGLSAERLQGTVFERDAAVAAAGAPERALNLAALESLFSDLRVEGGVSPSGGGDSEVRVLSASRAQHVSIVMHRVLGHSANVADVERLAQGLERLSLLDGGRPSSAAPLQDTERLDLLSTALPTAEEAAELESLGSIPEGRMRRAERLLMPLLRVPRAGVRLRLLQLARGAGSRQAHLRARAGRLAEAGRALRASEALRQVLRAVARLGSWINSSDPGAHGGFALSSALGKLRYFRALRGDRSVSLLHVAVLAAAGGDSEAAGALGAQLGHELRELDEASREDVRELGQAVADFAAEVAWFAREAERPEGTGGGGYAAEARERLLRAHRVELAPRAEELQGAWSEARAELSAALAFFAEPQEPAPGGSVDAGAAERLLRTVDAFRCDLQRAASEVRAEPERFAAVCAGPAARAQ